MSIFQKFSFFLIAISLFSLILFSENPTIFSMLLGLLLILLSYRDFLSFKIPDWINASILISGISYNIMMKQNPWIPITSFLIAGVLFYLLSLIYSKLRNRQGLGGGDIKLFACSALWLLPYYLPLVLLISSITALLYAFLLFLLNLNLPKKINKIPYGPFLAMGVWISFLFGKNIFSFFA